MRTLIWTKTFIRAYKKKRKKHPDLSREIEQTLSLLVNNPDLGPAVLVTICASYLIL